MVGTYNRQKAVEYAQKWALSHNPNFYQFEDIGGDCTNFISQCLLAGECDMNYNKYFGWFYVDSNNRSPSWASVEYFYRFLTTNTKQGPFATQTTLQNLKIGDIIQLRQGNVFNHTLIISKILNGEIYICAHTDDSLNRPLSSYSYIEHRALHIEGSYK